MEKENLYFEKEGFLKRLCIFAGPKEQVRVREVQWKGSDYKYSTILFIVSIKLGTKNKECLLFQFYEIDSVYLSSL